MCGGFAAACSSLSSFKIKIVEHQSMILQSLTFPQSSSDSTIRPIFISVSISTTPPLPATSYCPLSLAMLLYPDPLSWPSHQTTNEDHLPWRPRLDPCQSVQKPSTCSCTTWMSQLGLRSSHRKTSEHKVSRADIRSPHQTRNNESTDARSRM